MEYRFAAISDTPRLAAMNRQLIRDEHSRNSMTLEQLDERMKGLLNSGFQAVFLIVDGEEMGYALFRHEPDSVFLRHFWIDSRVRRRGIGRAAIQWLRENPWKGQSRIRLDVLTSNSNGYAFWRSMGFVDFSISLELITPRSDEPAASA